MSCSAMCVQFFPSVDHSILERILNRRTPGGEDGGIRRLIRLILDSGVGVLSEQYDMVYFPGDNLASPLELGTRAGCRSGT